MLIPSKKNLRTKGRCCRKQAREIQGINPGKKHAAVQGTSVIVSGEVII